MPFRSLALTGVLALLAFTGFALAQSTAEPTVATATFTVSYTIPTVTETVTVTASAQTTTTADPGRSVILNEAGWVCEGPQDLDLVKVTRPPGDALALEENCSGRIGRIEVDTWTHDGVKIRVRSPQAHDLVIGGGYIRCHANLGHQDGVQAMAGERITFRNLEIDCLGNSNFFPSAANGGMPTDVVCDGCTLGPHSASTLFIADSVRSGARNSRVCPGRFFTVRIDGAVDPVNENNTQPSAC